MAKPDAPPDAPTKLAAPERVAAFRTGLSAESRAAAFLMAKGYRILAKRFRTPYGEIDLVAKKRNLIAFIEVKARAWTMPPTPSRRASRGASSMPRKGG